MDKFFDFFALRVFKIIPKDFGGSQKIREIIFCVQEISGNFFRENPYTRSPANQNYSQLPKNMDKTPTYPQFSEVIAIEGTGRASGSLFCTFLAEIYAKKTESVKAR